MWLDLFYLLHTVKNQQKQVHTIRVPCPIFVIEGWEIHLNLLHSSGIFLSSQKVSYPFCKVCLCFFYTVLGIGSPQLFKMAVSDPFLCLPYYINYLFKCTVRAIVNCIFKKSTYRHFIIFGLCISSHALCYHIYCFRVTTHNRT